MTTTPTSKVRGRSAQPPPPEPTTALATTAPESEHPRVLLGGKEYLIVPLPITRSRQWRTEVKQQVGPLLALVQNMGAGIKIEQMSDIVGLLRMAADVVIDAPELIWSMVLAYSPEIARDRELLEEQATDREVFAVFRTMLRVMYPLDELVRLPAGLVGRLMS